MKLKFRNKIVVNLALQLVGVIAIISIGFSLLTSMQAREIENRIFDKAQLFSIILGTNLDKLIGDNLKAFEELQLVTVNTARNHQELESLRVIATENIILASSNSEELWQVPEQREKELIEKVVANKKPQSMAQSVLGNELIIHYLPILDKTTAGDPVMGVLQIRAKFPAQVSQLIPSLRSNKLGYYRTEASSISKQIAQELLKFVKEARRNFSYLESLTENMVSDEDIVDLKIFSEEIGILISSEYTGRAHFIASQQSELQTKAIQSKDIVIDRSQSINNVLRAASPLLIREGNTQRVGGAVELNFSLLHLNQLINENRNNMLIMSFAIIFSISLLIWLFFKRKILSPIQELIVLTERVRDDDYSIRSKIVSKDEIGNLAEAFNTMVVQLEKSKKEIKDWNLRLQDRVDQVSGELKEKQEQLMETEKLASLGVLSGGIAHEINNPLGIILGQTQMLLKDLEKGSVDEKEAEKLLKSVEEHTKRCSHIVKSLLQFTKTREVQLADTNVEEVVENSLLFTKNRLENKNIEVTTNFNAKVSSVLADPIQLEQVFINILVNAEQSIDDAGEITITTELLKGEKDELAVSFKDSGAGIEKEDLGKIFDPFYSTKEPGEGAGLGLSVSYGIIKAHGGDIEIQSEVGVGTTMTVKLPLS